MALIGVGKSTRETPRSRIANAHVGAVIFSASAMVLGLVTPAQATYYSGGLIFRGFGVTYQSGLNSTYTGIFTTARGSWNNAGVGAEISTNTLNVKRMNAGSYSQNWYGLYSPTGGRNSTRNFTIQINSRTLIAGAGTNTTTRKNWIRSTTTHELGHALSLADNPPVSGSASLMRYDRNRNTLVNPTAYDKNEVRRIYG